MNKMKTLLFIAGSALAGIAAMVLAGATSWLRKGKAQELSAKLEEEIKHAHVAEEFRSKVVEAVAEKAKTEAEKEKANDTVDNANSLIASLSGGSDS